MHTQSMCVRKIDKLFVNYVILIDITFYGLSKLRVHVV